MRPSHDRTDLAAVSSACMRMAALDDEEVLAHLTFTIAASFDALSSGTVSTLYYLAENPAWQDRVREELCNAVPSPADISLAELQDLPGERLVGEGSLAPERGGAGSLAAGGARRRFGGHVYRQGPSSASIRC